MGSQAFSSSGTFTLPAGVTSVTVQIVAGGGGGPPGNSNDGYMGKGGYAGQYKNQVVNGLSGGQAITVTIGVGGARKYADTGGAGNPGYNSSFGAYVVCTGGFGGDAAAYGIDWKTGNGQASGYPGSYGGAYSGPSDGGAGYLGGGGAAGNANSYNYSGAGGNGYCLVSWTDPPPTKLSVWET